ncbi:hypothetical protein MNB_SUP05-5-683 [hydrothermal vent metagenome]|uniref:Uncharacterized protein n=1 Tax=hydrothermal vent metagenome TaxID=652676 RepID=A0A1W1C7C7_9ZZZZ
MVKIINNSNKLNTPISFKMIKEKEWKIYDLSVSGISLMKNFSSYFNSLIKRKGVEGFIKSLENN